jgi:hypothetical protein
MNDGGDFFLQVLEKVARRYQLKCSSARKIRQKSALIPPHLPVELSDPT